MDLQPHFEPESTLVSAVSRAESAPYPGAFFPCASGFNITESVFVSNVTNNVSNPPPEEPSAFRTILLGDLDLMKEIHLRNESGVVGRQKRGGGVRRMYTAQIAGDESRAITVAIYQGDGAEEEWRHHVAKYESIRHPHIMKLYGLVKNQELRAMVFLNELIPFRQFLNLFEHSRILTSYIYAYCNSEWREAITYWRSAFPKHEKVDHLSFPIWIRPETGELCVELIQGQEEATFLFDFVRIPVNVPRLENVSLNGSNAEAVIISNFDDDKLHELFSVRPMARRRWFTVSAKLSFRLGPTIFRFNTQPRTLVPITEPLGGNWILDDDLQWWDARRKEYERRGLLNSWMRYPSRVRDLTLSIFAGSFPMAEVNKSWLAQANYMFAQLQTSSYLEDYVCSYAIVFILRYLSNPFNTHEPEGYLFVCPPEDFRAGDWLRWPDCPAYWTFDSSGATRLSAEDARILGFPIIHIETAIYGLSWDNAVYDQLRLFHQRRGFDPDTQEAAMHLGYPLFKLSRDVGTSFACGEVYRCDMKGTELCQELGHYI